MDAADRELFERSLANATEHHTGSALDDALAELGWPDALVEDRHAAVSLLFELMGATNATCGALDLVLLDALGPDVTDASSISVDGLAGAAITRSSSTLVVTPDGDTAIGVTVPTSALRLTPVAGLDPTLGLVTVTVDGALDDQPAPLDRWADAIALGQVALGHELVGLSRTMLALACDHAQERVQFDRPIAQFQAVRHRLADTLVAIETADAALGAAWDDPTPVNAAMAKALAGRGARIAARHCQQVLAGIGFTTEHDLHLYVRRALVLDELLGSARTLTRHLGAQVLTDKQLPRLLPL